MRPRRLRILRRPARLSIGVLLSQAQAATWPFRSCCAIETLRSVDMGQGSSCRARRTRSCRHDNAAICRSYVINRAVSCQRHIWVSAASQTFYIQYRAFARGHCTATLDTKMTTIFPDWHFSRWHAVDDRVRGGSSQSHLDAVPVDGVKTGDEKRSAARFWGTLGAPLPLSPSCAVCSYAKPRSNELRNAGRLIGQTPKR
jgi:hypothetical protein